MIYHQYVKIKTNVNEFDLNFEDRSELRDVLNDYILKEELPINLNILNDRISFMLESNGCISLEFKTKTESTEDLRDFYFKNLTSIFKDTIPFRNFEIKVDKEHDLTNTYSNFDTVLMFEETNLEPIIIDIEQIPENTVLIEFVGKMPMSSKEDLIIDLFFKDVDNNIIKDNFNINDTFKDRIKKTFNVDAQFHLTLGHMYKALFGSNPENKIKNAIESQTIKINTTRSIDKIVGFNTRVYFDI